MKTSKRIKPPTLASIQEFYDTVDKIARQTVQLREIEARRDEALQETRKSFEPLVAGPTEEIKNLSLLAGSYAEANRDQLLPGKDKSAETTLARFGFRTGMPTLKPRSGWTWAAVLNCIKELKLRRFLRQPEVEVDKEAIHRALNQKKPFPIETIGLRVAQDDGFFVEPKEKAEGVS